LVKKVTKVNNEKNNSQKKKKKTFFPNFFVAKVSSEKIYSYKKDLHICPIWGEGVFCFSGRDKGQNIAIFLPAAGSNHSPPKKALGLGCQNRGEGFSLTCEIFGEEFSHFFMTNVFPIFLQDTDTYIFLTKWASFFMCLGPKKNLRSGFFNLDDEGGLVKCGTIDLYLFKTLNTYIFFDKIGSIFDVLRAKKN
jgi:hypothetical protein